MCGRLGSKLSLCLELIKSTTNTLDFLGGGILYRAGSFIPDDIAGGGENILQWIILVHRFQHATETHRDHVRLNYGE